MFWLIHASISLLDGRDKKLLLLYAALLCLSSFLEIIAIVGVMPLVGYVVDPSIITSNELISYLFTNSPAIIQSNIVVFLGGAAALLLLFSLLGVVASQHCVRLFVVKCQNRLTARLFNQIFEADYDWFNTVNRTEASNLLITDALMWANDGILRALNILGSAVSIFFASVTLFLVSPASGLISIVLVGLMAGIITWWAKKPITQLSEKRRDASAATFAAAAQMFFGVKEIKISGKESYFTSLMMQRFAEYGLSGARMRLLQHLVPTTVIFLGQMFILSLALFMWFENKSGGEIAAVMALIVLVVSRLVPNLNRLINEINGVWACEPHILSLQRHFARVAQQLKCPEDKNSKTITLPTSWSALQLSNVTVNYRGARNPAIKSFSFEFKRGESYGIVGRSGSGKSTVVDLIAGLLHPESGNVYLDKKVLNHGNLRAWRNKVGYVSQTPFLLDSSIKANVLFGEETSDFLDKKIREALTMAGLIEFVDSLPDGINTDVGDKGGRLSGGQRQRLTIARSFFCGAEMLIFDEATSALDAENERWVVDAIKNLPANITKVVVSHNGRAVSSCDKILVLDHGILVGCGSFQEIMEKYPSLVKV